MNNKSQFINIIKTINWQNYKKDLKYQIYGVSAGISLLSLSVIGKTLYDLREPKLYELTKNNELEFIKNTFINAISFPTRLISLGLFKIQYINRKIISYDDGPDFSDIWKYNSRLPYILCSKPIYDLNPNEIFIFNIFNSNYIYNICRAEFDENNNVKWIFMQTIERKEHITNLQQRHSYSLFIPLKNQFIAPLTSNGRLQLIEILNKVDLFNCTNAKNK